MGRSSLALGLAAAALALVLTLDVWEALPELFRGAAEKAKSFEEREMVRGSAALTALVLPTTLMGLTFPLLLQSVAARPDAGRLVGRLTAINTIGGVLGSLVAGYLLLPWLGSQRTIVVAASAYAVVAVVIAAYDASRGAIAAALRVGAALAAVLAVVAGAGADRWDLTKLTAGYHVYFDWGRGPEQIVFASEDTQGGVTTVTEKDGVRTLLTNGKFQGNDGAEVDAQRFFAHYPAMFVRNHRNALVIGLGTGSTLGTVAAYPFEQIHVAEISPAIVHASRTYFGHIGGDALRDPRVRLFVEDGRNHLLVTDVAFDLVGIELTSVWFAGASSLYSREFYALVRDRLTPEGVLQQWIQLHHIYARDLATVIHTLRLEFAHVALFYGGGQGILVASKAPLVASRARLEALERTLGAARPSRPLASLGADVLATHEGLDAFVAEVAAESGVAVDALVSTDDNLYLEYATPRGNVLPWSSREEMVARLRAHRSAATIEAMFVD
jgi:spermidine synthase